MRDASRRCQRNAVLASGPAVIRFVCRFPLDRQPRGSSPHERDVVDSHFGPAGGPTPKSSNRQRHPVIRGSGTTNTLTPPIRPQDHAPNANRPLPKPLRAQAASCNTRSARKRPAPGSAGNVHKVRQLFLSPPTPAIPTTYPPAPLSPPPPSACPPDTMWLREGFARANLPRGKRIPYMMYGSPSVNSFVFNRVLPRFPNIMLRNGFVYGRNYASTPDWIDMGAWVGRQQAFAVIAKKCSAAQALSLKQMKESCSYEKFGLSWDDFCQQHAGHQPRPRRSHHRPVRGIRRGLLPSVRPGPYLPRRITARSPTTW